MNKVKIGNTWIGEGEPTYIIGEIGINHNGDPKIAEKLMVEAADAGCQAVKFQKRTIDVVYSAEELARPRSNPFGETNGELKYGLEFGIDQYHFVARRAQELGIHWFASCWDEASVDFMESFAPPAYKIASASLTDDNLLRHHRRTGKAMIVSTGMSTLAQIDHAVEVLGTQDLILLHTTSAYPSPNADLNLRMIQSLRERYQVPVGYSGHEVGLCTSVAAVALGACVVERHITLDRAMWGSDQAASVEPQGLRRMIRDIRVVEEALGDGEKKVTEAEIACMQKLRRIG